MDGENGILDSFLIDKDASVFDSLGRLNLLGPDLNLFVIDADARLIGSVTDGDIRRGIVNGVSLSAPVSLVMNSNCKYLFKDAIDLKEVVQLRKRKIRIVPILDRKMRISDLLNFSQSKTLLPVDALVMAGGKGLRLLPLTSDLPKPLLPVGGRPILSYSLDRLSLYGIRNISISVNYLRGKIEKFVNENYATYVKCIAEPTAMGTIGSITLVDDWRHEYILVTNSDLLTTIDYEDFFLEFLESGADMMVASIPYPVKIPYAILDTRERRIESFIEKPEYTFYANAGIYLLKRKLVDLVPLNTFYNTTDLMEVLIEKGMKLMFYPLVKYWLDIGSHDDYRKAERDVKHLSFEHGDG